MTTMFRYAAYAPNANRRGDVPVPVSSSFSSPMNEVSGCTLSYMPNSAGADLLQAFMEIAVEASVDNGLTWNEIPNGRYIRRDREYEKIAGGARQYTLTGYAWQLNKAIQWQTTGLNEDGKRPFLSASVGVIMKTLIDEAHVRGTIPGLTYDFDTGTDSNGIAWNKIITIYYEPGLSLYQILDNLSQQGMCDWRMQGRTLQIYNADTVMAEDRSASVRLQPGVDIKALPVKASIENLVNKALVLGDEGVTLELSNPAVLMPWGNWETSISNAGVSDTGTMTLLGQALLEDGGFERIQYTCELKMDTTIALPFGSTQPGSFQTGFYISSPNEETGGFQKYRIRQMNGRSDKDGKFQIDLVINDRFVEREIRNAKKTNGIVGGASAGGSGGRPTPPPGEGQDKRTPAAVTGLVLDSDAYIDHNGRPAGIINAVWAAVTLATDGTAIDVSGYQVAVRLVGGIWKTIDEVDDTDWSDSPYTPEASYQVRVRAIGEYTTKPGLWSAAQTIVIAEDTTAPAIPSTPTVDSRLGVITVAWDGLNETGAAMDNDFDRILIAMGTNATPTAVIGSLTVAGYLQVTDQAYESDRYFRFAAVDTSDNVSDWSVAAGPIAAHAVAAGDIDQAVNDAIAQAETDAATALALGNQVVIANTDNLISDPEFATLGVDTSNWEALAAGEFRDATGGYGGAAAFGITLDGAVHTVAQNTPRWKPVPPGSSYRLGVWVNNVGAAIPANAVTCYIQVRLTAGGVATLVATTHSLIPANTWTYITAAIGTTTASHDAIRVVLQTQAAAGAVGTIRISRPSITRAADSTLIVDGAVIASKIAADAIVAGKIAAGAIDGMTITGAVIRTAASGTRINMHGTSGFPGIWLYDSGANWRITLQVNDTGVPGLWLRDTAGVELMRVLAMDGGYIRSSYASGRTATYISQGEVFVYGDLDTAAWPDIFRTYWAEGDSSKHVYVGHENHYNDVFRAWADYAEMKGHFVQIQGTVGGSNVLGGSFSVNGNEAVMESKSAGNAFVLASGSGDAYIRADNGNAYLTALGSNSQAYVSGRGSGGVNMKSYSTDGANLRSDGSYDNTHIHHYYRAVNGDIRTGFWIDNTEIQIIAGGFIRGRVTAAGSVGILAMGTSSAGVNVIHHADGWLREETSSIRFKQDIQDHPFDTAAILNLRPRSWRDRGEVEADPETTNRYAGLIAEEVHELGLHEFVIYEADGTPRALAYDRMWIALVPVLQDILERLDALDGSPQRARVVLKDAVTTEDNPLHVIPKPSQFDDSKLPDRMESPEAIPEGIPVLPPKPRQTPPRRNPLEITDEDNKPGSERSSESPSDKEKQDDK